MADCFAPLFSCAFRATSSAHCYNMLKGDGGDAVCVCVYDA